MPRHPQQPLMTKSPGTTLVQSATLVTITQGTVRSPVKSTLMGRIEGLVSYTKSLEDRLQSTSVTPSDPSDPSCPIYPPSTYVCKTKKSLSLPKLEYLRLKPENVKVNDIIHCKSAGETIFCRVTKINPSGVNVDDLEIRWVKNHTEFHHVVKDMPHKGSLNYSRRMFILDQTEFIFSQI